MSDYLINTIQEITLQAYAFGVYDYLFEKRNMARTEIFDLFVKWAEEFEESHKDFDWDQGFFYDEVDDFIGYRLDSMKTEDKIREHFPYGLAVGDFITYERGIFKVTGVSERGLLVDEVKPCEGNEDWIVVELGFSQADKIDILPDYEEIMDTTNGHDPELVAKINIAWNEKREEFFPIMCALYKRDNDEILASDAFADWDKVSKDYDTLYEYMEANWDIEAYNYLQHIADDTDLECVLNFLHAQ
jgi:hypothetical protein